MNNKLFHIGKWVAVILLAATNYFSYMVSKQTFSMVFTIALILFSFYELFMTMKKKGLALGAYIYISVFYLLGILSLFMGVQSFYILNIRSMIMCFIMLIGDIALITYTIQKLSKPKEY